MTRLPRFVLPGQPQHVIQRGNNRGPVFFAEEDYRFYLRCLDEACRTHGCEVHAYVLMTNHVHLLLTPSHERSISKALQSVGRRYVEHVNRGYGRTGTLWQGRYRATLIDSERYLFTCMRYIELNPVRAGLVAAPGAYRWSSYAGNGEGRADPLLTPHPLYQALAASDTGRRAAYRALFASALAEDTLAALREATNKGWVLGDRRFQERIARSLNRRPSPLPRGGRRRRTRPSDNLGAAPSKVSDTIEKR